MQFLTKFYSDKKRTGSSNQMVSWTQGCDIQACKSVVVFNYIYNIHVRNLVFCFWCNCSYFEKKLLMNDTPPLFLIFTLIMIWAFTTRMYNNWWMYDMSFIKRKNKSVVLVYKKAALCSGKIKTFCKIMWWHRIDDLKDQLIQNGFLMP